MVGVVMGTASLGGILGPTVGGWGFDTTGSYDLVWYALTGCLVLATVFMARFRQ